MENQNHFFYALELPDEVKEKIGAAQSQLKVNLPFKSWVHPLDLHITLAFLGSASSDQLHDADHHIQKYLSNVSSFELQIDHLGTFGPQESPRIFWTGLNESPNLQTLRDGIFTACLKSGFKLETRPFNPHITLARKWMGNSAFTYGKLENFQDDKIIFNATRVVLYKTNLGNSPKYEPITTFSLCSR